MSGICKTVLVVALGMAALVAGCAKQQPVVQYAPEVTLADFATPADVPEQGYALVDTEQTVGRFACRLAVARFAPQMGAEGVRTTLADITPAEQGRWAETFRGIKHLSDLAFLNPVVVLNDPVDVPALCAAAREQRARLLLVYVAAQSGPNSAYMLGALYDTHDCTLLATLHAQDARLSEKGEELTPAELADEQDLDDPREVDAYYHARDAFGQSARAVMVALIRLDEPTPEPVPHRWTPAPTVRVPH